MVGHGGYQRAVPFMALKWPALQSWPALQFRDLRTNDTVDGT